MIGGFPLLSPTRDPDYNMAVITALVGLVMLVGGVSAIYVDGIRQRREVARGVIMATGVLWNPMTAEKLEGNFEVEIDAGEQMPEERTGFRHLCKAIRHKDMRATETNSSQVARPVLNLVFDVTSGLVKGEFASRAFNRHSDLDTIIFAKGTIIRVNGKKVDPGALCAEIGNELQQKAPNMIDVQVQVNLTPNAAAPAEPSKAGLFGAAMFGAVGGAVGAAIAEKRDREKMRVQAAQQAAHEEAVMKLFQKLDEVGAKFGWTTKIVRNAAG